MGLMSINGMGEMFEMFGTDEMMDMGIKIKYPLNMSPIGNPGPFGVIEMGGMFTIFKVRSNISSYVDPGWYQHPAGTVAEAVDISAVPEDIRNFESDTNRNYTPPEGITSWLSQEEKKIQPQTMPNNWMQSNPEDSMGGGHMNNMKNNHSMTPMQHMGH